MNFVKRWYFKKIAVVLAFAIFAIGSIPRDSMAYIITSGTDIAASVQTRAADMASVQRVLEAKMIKERLVKMGFSGEEVKSRMDKLSDEELHQFAKKLDTLYPGGDLGIIVVLLVIVILVMVILKLQDKKIVIK